VMRCSVQYKVRLGLQDAGVGLAGLSGSKTSLRELTIRGEAAGPAVTTAVAGAGSRTKRKACYLGRMAMACWHSFPCC
jgi:hypothetical protein